MKRRHLMGCLAICALAQLVVADPVPTPACNAWIQSLEPYGKAMDEALHRAEIEDAYRELEEASAVYFPGGSTEDLEALQVECNGIRGALSDLEPPIELQTLHKKLASYYGSVALSAARIRDGGLGAKPRALRAALIDLIAVYDRMLEDFAENGCENGDTEAIRERMLPELRQRLSVLEREMAAP